MDKLATGSNPLPYINEFSITTIEYSAVLTDNGYTLSFNAKKGRGSISGPKFKGIVTFDANWRVTSLVGERATPVSVITFLREVGFHI